MLDLPALPIAIALTLWDALPLFLSVAASLALLMRSILHGQSFHRVWTLRDSAGIEGILYVGIFRPDLLPVMLVAAITLTGLNVRDDDYERPVPESPGRALRQRLEEVFVAVLVASALAAVVKITSPSFPEAIWVQVFAAVCAGALSGFRAGTVAIPAVAIAVHMGGMVPAVACIASTVFRTVLLPRLLASRTLQSTQ